MKIDHIYCINLERSIQRRQKMEEQFERENIDVEFFKAWDAKSHGLPGHYGCTTSHLNIMKDILEKGYDRVLVLEDDSKICHQFKKQIEALVEPNVWDILYLSQMGNIQLDKPEISFTLGKCLSTAGYIIQAETCKKLVQFNPRDFVHDLDLLLPRLPLVTYFSNNPTIVKADAPFTGDIGFGIDRLHKHILFYTIEVIDRNYGLKIAIFALIFLIKFLFRK